MRIDPIQPKKWPSFGMALLFFGVLGTGLSNAATPSDPAPLTVDDVLQKVETAQAAVTDSRMDLTMEMKDTMSGQSQDMKGVLETKAPDKVFVHYTQPSEQFLYIEGGLMQMYQPDQKTVYQQKSQGGSDGAPIYVGVSRALKNYQAISQVSIVKDSGDEVDLLFVPKDPVKAGFDHMKVYIHKKDWWPYRMEVQTPAMDTRATFSNFAFNQGLKDSAFNFTPPKDAQVEEGAIF